MRFARIVLSIGLISLSSVAFAQSTAAPAVTTEAQKAFKVMKILAGVWTGPVKSDPTDPEMEAKHIQVSMRVTSSGNVLVHDMKQAGAPDDGSQMGDITLFYMDDDRLTLIHYCDAGNRPRMVAKASPDGKTIEFEFLDNSGGIQHGYMHDAVFTIIDANHHTEDWNFILLGDKSIHAHFDLQRVK